ncbi:MAG: phosphotransferase [Acidobacteriia bacterium]|nr:phosphotransferase [Terriglobia bacterium]
MAATPVTPALCEPIRVLIIDDAESDRLKAQEVLEASGVRVQMEFANDFDDASDLVLRKFFDVVVVDLVLHDLPPGPRETWEGLWVLQELIDKDFADDTLVVVLTRFGTIEIAIDAFTKFKATDFWDKAKPVSELVDSLKRALERKSYFGLASDVTFEPATLGWEQLIDNLRQQPHKLSSSFVPADAETELRHLLRRFFCDAESIRVSLMQPGASAASVLRITPYLGVQRQQADVVVKYGPLKEIRTEERGWRKIQGFIGGHKATRLERMVLGRQLAAVEYTFVGAKLHEVVPFAKYYGAESVENITRTLHGLFLETCGLWYGQMTAIGSGDANLSDAYGSYLGFSKSNIQSAFGLKYPEQPLSREEVRFAALPRPLLHPIARFCSGKADFCWPTSFCLTHGDLHVRNILVDRSTRDGWLIDFGRTDIGHWARDFVELEASIKFQLNQSSDLAALFEFEDALASAESLNEELKFERDDMPELQKAFDCIQAIRRIAGQVASKVDSKAAMLDYYAGLFYQTINYVRLYRLLKPAQRKNHVLISAALVLKRIDSLQRTTSTGA